jgi:hypothetical protein
MADSFHSARMSKLCLAHQRRKHAKAAKLLFPGQRDSELKHFASFATLRFCVDSHKKKDGLCRPFSACLWPWILSSHPGLVRGHLTHMFGHHVRSHLTDRVRRLDAEHSSQRWDHVLAVHQ